MVRRYFSCGWLDLNQHARMRSGFSVVAHRCPFCVYQFRHTRVNFVEPEAGVGPAAFRLRDGRSSKLSYTGKSYFFTRPRCFLTALSETPRTFPTWTKFDDANITASS